MNNKVPLPFPPPLYRTLSAEYIDPYTNKLTDIDPNSRLCSPEEKRDRELAILRDLPDSGYAEGIRERLKAEADEKSAAEFRPG